MYGASLYGRIPTSCPLAFGGRQYGECPYPMYRTTFGTDGASICVDVDACDTKPCWQVSVDSLHDCLNACLLPPSAVLCD